jgi:hypothetical protein
LVLFNPFYWMNEHDSSVFAGFLCCCVRDLYLVVIMCSDFSLWAK